MEKTTGIKLPTPFPKTLEIERTDSHIPSAPAAAAKLTQIQNPKGPSTVRLTFAPFRLILGLEKTPVVQQTFMLHLIHERIGSGAEAA
jgi:uncharacterized membrane protein YfhO